MDLKHLRTFVAVAENGTVTKAAARLHTAQPALSRQIIDLEKEIGIALFDRIGRRLRLTGEGEQFLESSRKLLGYASTLTDQAQKLRRGDSGLLTVTASPHMIDNVLSSFLHPYAEHYPNVQLKLIEGIGGEVFARVERGEAQFGIGRAWPDPTGADHFGSRPLLPFTFRAVYHAPFNLQHGRAIEIRDLVRYPLLVLERRFVMRHTFDAACHLARVQPNILFECSSPHTLLSLAEAGYGVAVVPSDVQLRRHAVRTLQIKHHGKGLQQPYVIFWDTRRSLPRYAHDFCELLARYIPKIIRNAPHARHSRKAHTPQGAKKRNPRFANCP